MNLLTYSSVQLRVCFLWSAPDLLCNYNTERLMLHSLLSETSHFQALFYENGYGVKHCSVAAMETASRDTSFKWKELSLFRKRVIILWSTMFWAETAWNKTILGHNGSPCLALCIHTMHLLTLELFPCPKPFLTVGTSDLEHEEFFSSHLQS